MQKTSAGILLYRFTGKTLQVLLVHPGGPFWAKKDEGAWSVPKGEYGPAEDPREAALRELKEETGITAAGDFIALTPVKQKSGKTVYAWAVAGDADTSGIRSNTFEVEWPPKSGNIRSFPEIDKAAWFTIADAAKKILPAQLPLLEEAARLIPEL